MKKTTKKSTSKGKTDRKLRDLSVRKGHTVKGGVTRRTSPPPPAASITGAWISS